MTIMAKKRLFKGLVFVTTSIKKTRFLKQKCKSGHLTGSGGFMTTWK